MTEGSVQHSDIKYMTFRQYLAAHAPPPPDDWRPVMLTRRPSLFGHDTDAESAAARVQVDAWDEAERMARYAQWPWAWAQGVISTETKPPTKKENP